VIGLYICHVGFVDLCIGFVRPMRYIENLFMRQIKYPVYHNKLGIRAQDETAVHFVKIFRFVPNNATSSHVCVALVSLHERRLNK